MKKMTLGNCRITIREVADDIDISFGSWQGIFTDVLSMKRVAKDCSKIAKFWAEATSHAHPPCDVDDVQWRSRIAQKGDKSWLYGYDIETKAQSSQEPRPKSTSSSVKCGFFDCNGVVHHKSFPQARTVNKEYYLEVMRRLREAIRQKRTEL